MVSPDGRVWIEVDGYWHFFGHKNVKDQRPSRQIDRLAVVQAKDAMLNQEARDRGVCLLRIATSCFYSKSGRMKETWLAWLTAMLRSPMPGVFCAGELYESAPWASSGCTIWKSPTHATTSFS